MPVFQASVRRRVQRGEGVQNIDRGEKRADRELHPKRRNTGVEKRRQVFKAGTKNPERAEIPYTV